MSSKFGQRLNPFEHCYRRPDTYIGSVVTVEKEMWVVEENKFVFKNIKYNAGLVRLFIEVMSNAIDNKWRSDENKVMMRRIDFEIDRDEGRITIINDGMAIPVKKNKYEYIDHRTGKVTKEELYPAELFFGEMLAGTNFEDDDTRKTSGKNGIGAKACVIFSTEAIIEHVDPDNKKLFRQIYQDNAKTRSEVEIEKYNKKTSYTSVSFVPDYKYFKYKGMDDDLFSLLTRYIYECAMITGLKVKLNGEVISVPSLSKFAQFFYPDTKLISFSAPNGDQCVLLEMNNITQENFSYDLKTFSWINGINTMLGGIHVDMWKDVIILPIVKTLNKKLENKGIKCSSKDIYPYIIMFVKAEREGAKFDSQMKDRMIGPEEDSKGKKYTLWKEDKMKKEFMEQVDNNIKKILKWNIISSIISDLENKLDKSTSKKEGGKTKKMTGDNLQEANFAGRKEKAHKCTLVITEGASARTFANRLIATFDHGPDYFGTFAIRGKFINTNKASDIKVSENKEVIQLKKILGLKSKQIYNDVDELRYGGVWIMTDQDDDGLHIRGLLLNFFYSAWPSLFKLKRENGSFFIESFSTSVIVTKKGKKIHKMFYSNPEFKSWSEKNKIKGLEIKYHKGLGSHDPKDVKLLYSNDPKLIQYNLDGTEQDKVQLAFSGKRTDDRKTWMIDAMKINNEDNITIEGEMSFSNFIDEQLIIYDITTLKRALPSYIDGFKDSQRKVFYGIMNHPSAKNKLSQVISLSGTIKEKTNYHHGEGSLYGAIIKMAQGFVGANNIPLLTNSAEFGSRYSGGEDAAAPRYLSTMVENISSYIFREEDEPILEHNIIDGQKTEFTYYEPIIPMILVNGASGIATGFSTEIPCYNPEDLMDWIEAYLKNDDAYVLIPWYRGFTGKITLLNKNKEEVDDEENASFWRSTGIYDQDNKGWIHIREIPVGSWTENIKTKLDDMLTGKKSESKKGKSTDKCLQDVHWRGTVNKILWDIKPVKGWEPSFPFLQNDSSLNNMYVLDENGYPKKYKSAEDIMRDFCNRRLTIYEKRKKWWSKKLLDDLEIEESRKKFIMAVIKHKLDIYKDDEELHSTMEKMELILVDDKYDYLLSMPIKSMTKKKVEEIDKKIENIKEQIHYYKKSPSNIWMDDIKKLREEYKKFLVTRQEE